MYQRVIFGEVTHEENRTLQRSHRRASGRWSLPVLLFIVWIGVYPIAFTRQDGGDGRRADRAGAEQGERRRVDAPRRLARALATLVGR